MINILTTQNPPNQDDLSEIYDFENINHLRKWESINSGNRQPIYEKVEERLLDWIQQCEEGKSVRFFIRPKNNQKKIKK